jgi:hypothetical protein
MNYIAKILLNSLYGRFGMFDNFKIIEILNKEDYLELENSNKLLDVTTLANLADKKKGDKYLVTYNDPNIERTTKMDGYNETHNVNIAIASAVTAYARIQMSQFKNNPTFGSLYYTDTDSLYFDNPLPNHFISKSELGALKLEGVYDHAIFLSPLYRVYALKIDNEEIIKIKGLSKEAIIKNSINLNDLSLLLTKDQHININQNKWMRSLSKANINILEQTYNLKVTGNKRELIYENNILVNTNPIVINKSN